MSFWKKKIKNLHSIIADRVQNDFNIFNITAKISSFHLQFTAVIKADCLILFKQLFYA